MVITKEGRQPNQPKIEVSSIGVLHLYLPAKSISSYHIPYPTIFYLWKTMSYRATMFLVSVNSPVDSNKCSCRTYQVRASSVRCGNNFYFARQFVYFVISGLRCLPLEKYFRFLTSFHQLFLLSILLLPLPAYLRH